MGRSLPRAAKWSLAAVFISPSYSSPTLQESLDVYCYTVHAGVVKGIDAPYQISP